MKKILLLIAISTNLLLSQLITKVSMSICWIDNDGIKKEEKIDEALITHFMSCLREPNRSSDLDKADYLGDNINIKFFVNELKFIGTLFTVTTNNLHFCKCPYPTASQYHKDVKGLFLLRTFIDHFSQKVWNYPRKMTTRDDDNIFYINYKLPEKKQLYFSYYNFNAGKLPAFFTLQKVEYYQLNEVSSKTKKKKGKIPEGKFVETDFVDIKYNEVFGGFSGDYCKYTDSFYDYIKDYSDLKK